MKATSLICCVLVLALFGLSCTPGAALKVSTTDDEISVSATLVEDGVRIENLGGVDCLVFMSSLEGAQQFELAVGENVTVTNISQPIEVSEVSLATS